MAKIQKKWIDLDYASQQGLKAAHIPYNESLSIFDAISNTAGASVLEENVVSMLDVGGVKSQDTLVEGLTFTEFAKKLLHTTFYPTYSNPTFSLTSNQSSQTESGTEYDLTLTYNFGRGSINGDMVAGIWNPSTAQNQRAGAATEFVIEGTSTGLTNTRTLTGYQVVDGANTFNGSVTYGIGPQPLDSSGANFETPYPAGTQERSVTINGRRNRFHGVSNSAATSADIRSLTSTLNPSNGNTFSISIPVGATNVVFAYPATLRDVSSVKYVEGMNAEIKDTFVLSNVQVEGANGYNAISYKVYVFTPVEPFSATATYQVTI